MGKPVKFFISLSVTLFLCPLFLSMAEAAGEEASEAVAEQYRVTVGDLIKIIVYQEGDLSDTFEVKETGSITYPLLGQVYVEGLTKLEIESKLAGMLEKDYLVDPNVRVVVSSYFQRQVLLLGHVTSPGTYAFPEGRNLTLLELITVAGGFTGYASVNGTKIIRTLEDGNKEVIESRMNDIINGKRKDIELMPGDLVIVPERLF